MTRSNVKANKKSNGGNLGFEEKLWQAADKMRGHMDPAEYKHVVLGLIFLKYISDAFEERHTQLAICTAEPTSEYYVSEEIARYGVVEDRDEYISDNIFWVPKEARWSHLQAKAKQPAIGKLVDDAMIAIEKENPQLKGVLPKDYARPTLDKHTLGELIDLTGTLGLGDAESRSKDILGRVYEYFLGRFASAEGKGEGVIYKDIPGFCMSATLEEIRARGHVLTPGRYIGAEDIEDDGEPFDQKMKRLTAKLEEQFRESARLEVVIRRNLKELVFE
jgi:type I restriction-modification system DNA methylase subunit